MKGRAAMPLEDVVALYASLVNLALKCYPNRLDYVDTALLCTVEVFTKREATPYVDTMHQLTVIEGPGFWGKVRSDLVVIVLCIHSVHLEEQQ